MGGAEGSMGARPESARQHKPENTLVKKFHPIPTNIITGFLGTGKTTSILHLLRHNTGGEKWAVLVNEFGEVGIDGALLTPGAFAVKEVPGGCMCCAAGLPTQIALNKLIGGNDAVAVSCD